MSTFKNRIFKDRIKPIVIAQIILLILLFIYMVYFFTHVFTHNINPIYRGLSDLVVGAYIFFSFIEIKILKKKEFKNLNLWLLSAIIFFIIGITELISIV